MTEEERLLALYSALDTPTLLGLRRAFDLDAHHAADPTFIRGRLKVIARILVERGEPNKCDGNHAQTTLCNDPECWQGREGTHGPDWKGVNLD